MAFIPVPKTAICHVVGELYGQIIENTLTFAFDDDPLASQVAQLAASVGQWAVAELCQVLGAEYTYLRTEAQSMVSESSPAYTDTVGTGTTGADLEGACAPGGTCAAVSFRTALGGRSYRGRNYVSGIPTERIVGNQVDSGYATSLVDAYEALMSYITDDLPDAVHVVVSKYTLGAPRVTGITTPILTYLMTNRDIDSQRRRLTGRGN